MLLSLDKVKKILQARTNWENSIMILDDKDFIDALNEMVFSNHPNVCEIIFQIGPDFIETPRFKLTSPQDMKSVLISEIPEEHFENKDYLYDRYDVRVNTELWKDIHLLDMSIGALEKELLMYFGTNTELSFTKEGLKVNGKPDSVPSVPMHSDGTLNTPIVLQEGQTGSDPIGT